MSKCWMGLPENTRLHFPKAKRRQVQGHVDAYIDGLLREMAGWSTDDITETRGPTE